MNLSRRNMLKAGAAALVTAPLTTKADANDFWNQHRRPIPQNALSSFAFVSAG